MCIRDRHWVASQPFTLMRRWHSCPALTWSGGVGVSMSASPLKWETFVYATSDIRNTQDRDSGSRRTASFVSSLQDDTMLHTIFELTVIRRDDYRPHLPFRTQPTWFRQRPGDFTFAIPRTESRPTPSVWGPVSNVPSKRQKVSTDTTTYLIIGGGGKHKMNSGFTCNSVKICGCFCACTVFLWQTVCVGLYQPI